MRAGGTKKCQNAPVLSLDERGMLIRFAGDSSAEGPCFAVVFAPPDAGVSVLVFGSKEEAPVAEANRFGVGHMSEFRFQENDVGPGVSFVVGETHSEVAGDPSNARSRRSLEASVHRAIDDENASASVLKEDTIAFGFAGGVRDDREGVEPIGVRAATCKNPCGVGACLVLTGVVANEKVAVRQLPEGRAVTLGEPRGRLRDRFPEEHGHRFSAPASRLSEKSETA